MYHYLAFDQFVNKIHINDITNSLENFHDSLSEPMKYKSVTIKFFSLLLYANMFVRLMQPLQYTKRGIQCINSFRS